MKLKEARVDSDQLTNNTTRLVTTTDIKEFVYHNYKKYKNRKEMEWDMQSYLMVSITAKDPMVKNVIDNVILQLKSEKIKAILE